MSSKGRTIMTTRVDTEVKEEVDDGSYDSALSDKNLHTQVCLTINI